MKKNKSTIILILVFFVGLSVMLYPTLSALQSTSCISPVLWPPMPRMWTI